MTPCIHIFIFVFSLSVTIFIYISQNVTVTSYGHHDVKSLATGLFVWQLVQANNKENIKAVHHWSLFAENPQRSSGFPAQRACNVESISMSWRSSCLKPSRSWSCVMCLLKNLNLNLLSGRAYLSVFCLQSICGGMAVATRRWTMLLKYTEQIRYKKSKS